MSTHSEKYMYIIGAGFAGQMLAAEIKRKKIFGTVAAFLDDDPAVIGKTIEGIPVIGPINQFCSFLRHSDNDEAVIAIPSATQERICEIYDTLSKNGFRKIRILPSISQITDGGAHFIQTRGIDPLDLLGRTPVTIPLRASLAYLRGKRVLITGAGGSIGSELARQLLSGGAERLYLFGHGENSIYQIDRELRLLQKEGVGEKAVIVPIIGDLKNRHYMQFIMQKLKCDVVFHCAAYKHVPLMEENPVAVIENNVFGTKNLLDASIGADVKRFVLISTDKAVEPVSVYGISKMICEKLVIAASREIKKKNDSAAPIRHETEESAYMFVRFGNVLGSRGSIVPLFTEQLKNGGPLTVTDSEAKRFFMTIPEACSLVLMTGGVGENGVSYVLDMGDPIKISDIAEQIIRISGYEPYKDIDIQFIGLRNGERLDEPLWIPEENPEKTKYPKLLRLRSAETGTLPAEFLKRTAAICLPPQEAALYAENGRIDAGLYRDKKMLTAVLEDMIPSYKIFKHGC
ncbi:MAG: polysaccharide biosynthesis protein [Bacteroides sp.]|nr:polysaccharide biosynthesis protein [Prevotella sp.]MCM1407236.1 polysaccharide biosynthesis protein [Treponema brennaborense]MCM1469724.1 polysaccharide biosynthesis protein [Bacteroides sp.]